MFVDVVARAGHQRTVDTGLDTRQRHWLRAAGYHATGRVDANTVEPGFVGRRSVRDSAVGLHRERAAIEDQLVLATDHIDVDHRQAGFLNASARNGLAPCLRTDLIGRAVDGKQEIGAGLTGTRAGLRLPDVLADRQANAHAADIDNSRRTTLAKIPLLVEDFVVRQEPLAVPGEYLAVAKQDAGVENGIVVVFRNAQQHGDTAHFGQQTVERLLHRASKAAVKQEVFRRVPAKEQLGKHDQVGTKALDRVAAGIEHLLGVAVDIADKRVFLRKRNGERGHSESLAGPGT